jgi:hypothetical protein
MTLDLKGKIIGEIGEAGDDFGFWICDFGLREHDVAIQITNPK